MVHKLYFLAGLAVGYVLGTRAGRERYEELKAQAARVAEDPKVRAVAEEAREKATEVAAAGVEKVKETTQELKEAKFSKAESSSTGSHSAGGANT